MAWSWSWGLLLDLVLQPNDLILVLVLVLRKMSWSWRRSWSKFCAHSLQEKWSSVLQLPVTCSLLNITYVTHRQTVCFAFFLFRTLVKYVYIRYHFSIPISRSCKIVNNVIFIGLGLSTSVLVTSSCLVCFNSDRRIYSYYTLFTYAITFVFFAPVSWYVCVGKLTYKSYENIFVIGYFLKWRLLK